MVPLCLGALDFLTLRFVHPEPPAIPVQIFLSCHWFLQWILLMSLLLWWAEVNCNFLYSPDSSILGKWFALSSSFYGSKKKCLFSSPFSFLYIVRMDSDFQAPCMWNWKPEFHPVGLRLPLLLQFSHSVVSSDSLWPHGLKHARLSCSSLSPGVCSNSCPLSWWCHSTISSSEGVSSLLSLLIQVLISWKHSQEHTQK